MDVFGWIQLALFMGILFLVAKPMGLYLVRVLEPDGKTWLDRPVRPAERLLYRVLGIDPGREQDWGEYARSLIIFSLAGMLFTYAVLRLQRLAPVEPPRIRARSARTSPSTRRPASRRIRTGRITRGKRRSPIFRRWSGWSSTISSRRPPASQWPRPWSAASPGIRPGPSETSGSTSSGSTSISFFLSP